MGHYVNPIIDNFEMSLNSAIYVDKSNLIAKTNALLRTRQRFACISRPRRFGKTMAAEMLAAYYGRGETAKHLFDELAIASDPSYEAHLNKYDVIMINIQDLLEESQSIEELIAHLQRVVGQELMENHPHVTYRNVESFVGIMQDIFLETRNPFVILIDEWDCIFREYKKETKAGEKYLKFLRLWLKDKPYVGLAYMTGILPIKKYGSHSALNMFGEYSMVEPGRFIDYFGFRDFEVEALIEKTDMDIDEIKKWYNGYFVEEGTPVLNPTSITRAIENNRISNYWNKTERYEALKDYIAMNFDDLKEKVTEMIAGSAVHIDTRNFANDMTTFESADDILTLLVHLGYLSYHFESSTVRIPNAEVKDEFITSVKSLKWAHVIDSIKQSDKLLNGIWNQDIEFVAMGIQNVHEANTSILAYNDENALASVLGLALYTAVTYYTIVREMPTGEGYADLVFIPRKKHLDKPALIVELKYDKSVTGAIHQIKTKHYVSALEEYEGNLLLVGINYNKTDKTHECVIEAYDYKKKNV